MCVSFSGIEASFVTTRGSRSHAHAVRGAHPASKPKPVAVQHIKVRGIWFCAAPPPGVYSTTSSGIYRMHMRPTFTEGCEPFLKAGEDLIHLT